MLLAAVCTKTPIIGNVALMLRLCPNTVLQSFYLWTRSADHPIYHPNWFFITAGDFNHANVKTCLLLLLFHSIFRKRWMRQLSTDLKVMIAYISKYSILMMCHITSRVNQKPWLTVEIHNLLKIQDTLFTLLAQSSKEQIWYHLA